MQNITEVIKKRNVTLIGTIKRLSTSNTRFVPKSKESVTIIYYHI